MCSMYTIRVCLSVTIVAMAGEGVLPSTNATNTTEEACPRSTLIPVNQTTFTTPADQEVEFDWDAGTQGLILGSFYWGYASTNFLGGRLSEHLGGRLVFGLGIVLTSVFTILGPLCARTSTALFIASRVLAGAMQGLSYPAVNTLLATWVPPNEKSKYTTIVFGGLQIGTLLGLPVSGLLCSSELLGGWPSVFYVFGAGGMAWAVVWFLLVHDRPENHPRITQEELKQLQAHQDTVKGKEVVPIPWKSLATSLPFWSVVIVSLGDDLGFSTLLSDMPTYLENVQHFDISSNGLVSAMPFFAMWLVSVVWAWLMDLMTRRGTISLTSVRRLSMAIGMFGPALGLMGVCLVGCEPMLAVVLLCVAVGCNGAVNSGHLCSNQDLAPNLAGTLLGITNTGSAIMGIIAPVITGYITQNNPTLSGWQEVFYISIVVYIVTTVFYLVFITAQVQPWNNAPQKNKNTDVIHNQEV